MGEWLPIEPAGNRAYLATPMGGSGPGVLVLHAWWGLTEVFTGVCDRLAANGFVALAPSLYPDAATTDSIPDAEQLVAKHDADPGVAEGIMLAAVDRLRGLPAVTGDRIGAIGFSMGAYWAFNLSQARPAEVGAVVAVYGAGDGDFTNAQAAYLGHWAEHDPYESPEWRQILEDRIRSSGRDYTSYTYPGTTHWFVEPNRPDVYNHHAAELMWERTLAFFKDKLN
jgi:carboxymethylenebutenolidase